MRKEKLILRKAFDTFIRYGVLVCIDTSFAFFPFFILFQVADLVPFMVILGRKFFICVLLCSIVLSCTGNGVDRKKLSKFFVRGRHE